MKQSEGFILTYIKDIPYLLPYGQRIAEQRRGMKLNESGVFLWNSLPQVADIEELTTRFANHCQATEDELPRLREDVKAFVTQLTAWGMIDNSFVPPKDSSMVYVKIAGLKLLLQGPADAFSKEFIPFHTQAFTTPDMIIEIHTTSGLRTTSLGGILRIHTDELFVCETEHEYHLSFPMAQQIVEARLQKDGKRAQIFCTLPYRETLVSDIFHAIRLMFLYLAGQHNMRAIHSASIYYKEKAWLFSGSSGTGKSTHTNLWNDLYGTPIINGDLNLIACSPDSDTSPIVHGTPWCGTSGIADTKSYELGGIILLKQAQKNICLSLSEDEKALLVMQRMISPSWTDIQTQSNIVFAEHLTQYGFITKLLCTKAPEAATYMKSQVDAYLHEMENRNDE